TRSTRDWSSDVCSSDLLKHVPEDFFSGNPFQYHFYGAKCLLISFPPQGEDETGGGFFPNPEREAISLQLPVPNPEPPKFAVTRRSEERRVGKDMRSGP